MKNQLQGKAQRNTTANVRSKKEEAKELWQQAVPTLHEPSSRQRSELGVRLHRIHNTITGLLAEDKDLKMSEAVVQHLEIVLKAYHTYEQRSKNNRPMRKGSHKQASQLFG